jgi:hypothetical protein
VVYDLKRKQGLLADEDMVRQIEHRDGSDVKDARAAGRGCE